MTNVAIIGASGYVGGELLRLLLRHPQVSVVAVTSEQSIGKPIRSVFPNLAGPELVYEAFDPQEITARAEAVFLALPHTKSAPAAAALFAKNPQCKVIDLSADFRLKDPASYAHWYGTPHPCPALLSTSVYGLPELHRAAIASAHLVASPGCYPTAALLSLAPLAKHGMLDDMIVIDAKSGISGAGRSPTLATHFPEANESIEAYQLGVHRHIPEIEQELGMQVSFTPHLVPMTRGILSTAHVRIRKPHSSERLTDLYREWYKDEPFIRVLDVGQPVNPRNTRGSNFCDISAFADSRTGWTILTAGLDNLVKGAAGQAVQAMNLMHRWPETTGLQESGLYP